MANKIYVVGETPIIFGSEATEVAWSTESIIDGAGRQSAFFDRGVLSTAKPGLYMVRFFTQAQATPVLGNACELYLKTSDGTHPDNDDGVGDAAVSAEDKLRNLHPMRPAIVDEAAANIEFVSFTPRLVLSDRYVAFVLWNEMGATITTDVAKTKAILTPLPPEIQ